MIKEKFWSKEFERPVFEKWKKNKCYAFNRNTGKPVFSIDTPPPYVNAPIHIGHATTYTLMDMFARYRRMKGFEVLFPLGLDRNGLPIEVAAEKKFEISILDMKREKFLEYCHKLLEESSDITQDSFLRLGISFNSWEEGKEIGDVYLTDSDDYRALTQATFIDMWNRGLIYEDNRINNYCPGCRTTLADEEIDYIEVPTDFNDIIFTCKETGEQLIIGTTRPELICTCGMVIYNPDDERYKHLEGKTAVTPIFEKEVPIRPHTIADMEKGTGLVMMCSAGDQSDIRFFREIGLEPVIAIEADGTMNRHAGLLNGLKVADARKKMKEELKKRKLLVASRKIMHKTPVCERSKDHIEFIAMPEYYLKQVQFKEDMKKIARQIKFFAPESRQILLDWIDNVSIDWPISRRRYYATEIPLWRCKKCSEFILPPKGKYYQPWKERPPVQKCRCGSTEFKGEERVLDTWVDSSISPLYILGYPSKYFQEHSPCTLRPQGKEIVRSWLYYTLLRCYLLTDRSIFRDVWINFHILDERGKKMSKSLGNIIDPQVILEKFGAEPFRLWTAAEGNLEKTDFKCSMERIEGSGKTLAKLWNVARFVSQFQKAARPKKLCETDAWIINELNKIIELSEKCYEKYDFHNPTVALRHFLWETFASHYIEMAKNRAYNQHGVFTREEQESALFTLHRCLETILKLWAPVIPLITYKLYEEITGKDVHMENFPETERIEKFDITTEEIIQLNSAIWRAKKDNNISLKHGIKEATIPERLRLLEKDLKAAHGIEKLKYGEEIKVVV
jgi:valyl-tRNA synthetase